MCEKTGVTLRLGQEALDLVLKQGYATRRTLGEFLSQLILDYHQRQGQPTASALHFYPLAILARCRHDPGAWAW
jgi:hypothetical protein